MLDGDFYLLCSFIWTAYSLSYQIGRHERKNNLEKYAIVVVSDILIVAESKKMHKCYKREEERRVVVIGRRQWRFKQRAVIDFCTMLFMTL